MFSPQPPLDGQCTPGTQEGKQDPGKLFPHRPLLPCLQRTCLLMNSVSLIFVEVHVVQKVKKGYLCFAERSQQRRPENRVLVRLHPKNSFPCTTRMEDRAQRRPLSGRGCGFGCGPCLDPCLLSQGQENGPKLQINRFPGKTNQHPSPCGNKQQLVPRGFKLFAFVPGGPQIKKFRAPSSWENMLQKEN